MALIDKLTNIADAIRGKTGTTEEMTLDAMAEAIAGIEAGGCGGWNDPLVKSLVERSIAELDTSELEIIEPYAFSYCPNLKTVNLPSVVTVKDYAFRNCEKMTSVNLPNVTDLKADVFNTCKSLADVYIPSVSKIWNGTFVSCTSLEVLDLPLVSQILQNAMAQSSKLKIIVLRYAGGVASLVHISALTNTQFASGKTGGVLLVPSALVESYKTATNWSIIYGYGTNRFLAVEDYTVDGTATGEIDWDKVNALF